MIPQETIRQIHETAKIEEVVGDFMTLRRRGTSLIGSCPFHNEKTPSFHVNAAKNIFKCFGCGIAGDSVKFVMEHEHFSYPEALRYVAKKYGIEVKEKEQTPEDIQKENERESMFIVNEFAKDYFKKILLNDPMGRAVGLSYFKAREFANTTIEKFQLGYSAEDRDNFVKHALKSGYSEEILVKTGLAIKRDDGSLFDRFFGRVMFPIHSVSGKVIGFGGRILGTRKDVGKYLNSPESDIFSKSKVLYGLYFAKSAISKKDECFLVEGYTDVISMHQAGIENVVASMGTSLTEEQIPLISRYTQNITILYDGDYAGIKAALRGTDMLLAKGLNVRIVLFPEGEDPDCVARTHKSNEVEEYIKQNSEDFIKFKTKILLKDVGNDPIKRTAMLKEIVETIAIIPDRIARGVYTAECSRLLNFDESILINEVNKIIKSKLRKNAPEEDSSSIPPEEHIRQDTGQEQQLVPTYFDTEVLRLLLLYSNRLIDSRLLEIDVPETDVENPKVFVGNVIVDMIVNVEGYDFYDPLNRKIFTEMAYLVQENPEKSISAYFYHHSDGEVQKRCIDITDMPHVLCDGWAEKEGKSIKTEEDDVHLAKVLNIWLCSLRLNHIEKLRKEIEEKTKNEPENLELMLHLKIVLEEKKKIAAKLHLIAE